MHSFLKAYSDLLTTGSILSPRDQEILEIENYRLDLHPILDRFTNFASRKMNIPYAKKEFAWYLRGDRYEMTITDEAQMWKNIIDIDGGINSNYGQYIFHDQSQFKWVIEELKRDKDSRRAVMTLLNNTHLRMDNPDVVCTYSIGFRIRNNKLNMTIHMRSWDAVWGMTNDVFCFSCIYEIIYNLLLNKYPDLMVGSYVHTADSFHVYKRHYDMLKNIVKEESFEPVYVPSISGTSEAQWLINHKVGATIPKQYKFSRWLLEQ